MKRWLVIIGVVIVVLAFLVGAISAAFLLTEWVYQTIGQHPPAFLAQLIDSLLGLIFSFLFFSGLSYYFGSRRGTRQAGVLGPITEALERIARGDFSARVDSTFAQHENDLFGGLVSSVNNMALELSRLERMRQEFISDVSHEIQSPLTSIRGFAEALQDDQLSVETRHHYLGVIETESSRLARITDNLLRLAALESDQPRFEPKAFRLDKQIRNLILACEPQWSAKEIDMDVSLEEVSVTADEDLLGEVWTNLIHNGIKFTPPGGRVGIELSRANGEIQVSIKDSGIGISEEDQARIFERFYKADPARTGANGSGLGLAIAKKIVEMHRGAIQVESQLGTGTQFTVALPAVQE